MSLFLKNLSLIIKYIFGAIGVIMYELHAPIMIQATRLFEAHEINTSDLKRRLREVVKLLKESEQILAMEPEGSSENTMAVAARDALKRIGKV